VRGSRGTLAGRRRRRGREDDQECDATEGSSAQRRAGPGPVALLAAVPGADHFDGCVDNGFQFRFVVEALTSLEHFVA